MATSNLCILCHSQPRWHDGTRLHDFCTKTCATNMKAQRMKMQLSSLTTGNCDYCHKRPKCIDGRRTHAYCSKTCAKAATANGGPLTTASQGIKLCKIPGCPALQAQINGNMSDYCSKTHQILAKTTCLMCYARPKQTYTVYCGITCANKASNMAPFILEVPAGHVAFEDIAAQFKTSWRHPSTCPPVKAVYKIVGTQSSLTKYKAYRAAVEARGGFEAAGKTAGNECRRWHGTKRQCQVGDKNQTDFCPSTKCSLCCIMKTSFDLNAFGKKTGWGRFGSGIYTSSTSSKSNDYSTNGLQSPWKAMLLNRVVVGKGFKLQQDRSQLSCAPAGFDSVLGEKGGSLNHDELIVYENDAIRPSWLVMYAA